MRFTQEEIQTLSQYERFFHTAKSGYKRATTRNQDETIAQIYEKASGKKLPSHNWGCSICSLNLYKTAGEKYYEDKAFYDKQEKEQEKEQNQTPQPAPIENKPAKTQKKTNKKKTTKK